MAERLREFWPGWETVRLLGHGSFGCVYEIRRQLHGFTEHAALKVLSVPQSEQEIQELRLDGYEDRSITEYFTENRLLIEREYAMMAQMRGHSNVVYCDEIRSVQQDNGFGWDVFIKMELLTPLKAWLTAPISQQTVIRLGMNISSALILCEKLNVIHRDIKPENIFVSQNGDFKLGDFGIARTMDHTTIGTKVGTYEYMAPEVFSNRPYNATADIYSLGLVMYWMLNGRMGPFLTGGKQSMMPQARSEARNRRFAGEPLPAPANGSPELHRIILKACAFDPEDRYASASDLCRDLEALNYRLHSAPAETPTPASEKPRAAEPAQLTEAAHAVTPPPRSIPGPNNATASPESFSPRREPKYARKQRNVLLPVLLFIMLLAAITTGTALWVANSASDVSGSQCDHSWQEATCTSPKTCTLCSKTSGKALGHNWSITSVDKICQRCGISEGTNKLEFSNFQTHTLVSNQPYSIALKADGTVNTTGACFAGVANWENIVDLAASSSCTVGLKTDGTVVIAGSNADTISQVSKWQGITAVAAGREHVVGLKADGTVVAAGGNIFGQCDVSDWTDIVALAAGYNHTAGLKKDGTVVATGSNANQKCDVSNWQEIVAISAGDSCTVGLTFDGRVVSTRHDFNISLWRDIIAISAGHDHVVGLKADGTVVAAGSSNTFSQLDVSDWKDIVCIAAGFRCTIGLKKDGTAISVGDNTQKQCDVSRWDSGLMGISSSSSVSTTPAASKTAVSFEKNLHNSIAAGSFHTVGLRTNGTVVAIGSNEYGQCDVSGWENIVSVTAGYCHTVCLRSDGTVVATGSNNHRQNEVSEWQDIASIAAGNFFTMGLKADGTVVATGSNAFGQCDVSDWTNIVAIAAGNQHAVGLRADGTVVAIGSNASTQCDVADWKDIVAISAADTRTVGLKKDGTVVYTGSENFLSKTDFRNWRNVIAVSAGAQHIVGLEKDGTVIASGYNSAGQCDVSEWRNVVAISAGRNHTVALLADGTAVATGLNQDNQCNISDWKNILVPQ